MFYLIGDLFQLLFTPYKIPYFGHVINWTLTIVGTAMLIYWSKKLISMGTEDDRPYSGI